MILNIDTKKDKSSTSIKTALTVDLTNLDLDDIQTYALQTIVVKWQGITRRKGTIPTVDTYIVPRPGTRATVNPEHAARMLPVEQLEAIVAEKKAILRKAGE